MDFTAGVDRVFVQNEDGSVTIKNVGRRLRQLVQDSGLWLNALFKMSATKYV